MTAAPPCGSPKKASRGGGTCGLPAGWGTGHPGVGRCKLHGGKAPNAEKAGQAAILEMSFFEWLRTNGEPDNAGLDPVATITRVLHRTVQWHDFIEEVVGGLSADDWKEKGPQGAVQLSVYVQALERAQDRAHKHLADLIRLGIEDRLAAITVRQGEAVIAAISAGVAALGLPADRAEVAIDAAARELESLAGGPRKALTA